jgi:hypothetical protein
VGPRAGPVDTMVKKNFQTLSGLEPPIIQLVAQRYTTELSPVGEFRNYYTSLSRFPAANFSDGRPLCGY